MNYYIHIPFCNGKCGYCAFYSEGCFTPQMVEMWLDKCCRKITGLPPAECETIYIGGGTPTILTLPQLERLFDAVSALRPAAETEITIEANPETLTEEKISFLREHVNRISIGVQSFSEDLRRTLGRKCSQTALENALELVKKACFPYWNIDLIYAIPGQTPEMWQSELQQAANLGCDHVSCYNLTPEEGARLAAELIPDEENSVIMWELAQNTLSSYGIKRYEISNYARPGSECHHNCNVWQGGLLTGIGPAAAGFDGRRRIIQPDSLTEWLNDAPPFIDEISVEERRNEIFAVNLRTVDGWTPEKWGKVPNADSWEERQRIIRETIAQTSEKFFDISPERITLSPDGSLFWNTIAESMI